MFVQSAYLLQIMWTSNKDVLVVNFLKAVITEKYDRECNFTVAFLFVLPVFGALLWADVWAGWVFYLISVKRDSCEWLCYAENQMWDCGLVGFSSAPSQPPSQSPRRTM